MQAKGMVSIILPVRNEIFLSKTIQDLLVKAKGNIEIIVSLDGYWPSEQKREYWSTPAIIENPKVIYIHRSLSYGMRSAINDGVAVAKGEYIMKLDGHCMLDEGFDEKLKADYQDNWVVIPRRHRLDAEKWEIQEVEKPPIDYMYLSFPDNPADFGGPGLNGRIWTERIIERLDKPEYLIDDNPSFQGSCWFMKKDYFYQLELMDEENYGTFANEAQEIGLKAWLSGGRVIVNKKTWYAHLHKGKTYGRGYFLDTKQLYKGASYTKKWIYNQAWDKQTLPFSWIIEHFWPMPTWTDNWKELLNYKEP